MDSKWLKLGQDAKESITDKEWQSNRRAGEIRKKHFSLPLGKLLWLWCVMSICQFCTLFVNRHADKFVFICIYLPIKYYCSIFTKTQMKTMCNLIYNIIIFISLLSFLHTRNKLSYLKNKVWKMQKCVVFVQEQIMADIIRIFGI